MAGDIKNKYGTSNQTITCTVGNSGSGTASQHGRISAAIDNSSDVFQEVFLQGKIKTGTSPSGDKQFVIYALGSADGGSNYTDGYSIGDADSSVLVNTARSVINVPAPTTATTYPFGPIAVSPAFGGEMPDHWGIFVFNDDGVTTSTTNGDHAFWYQGKYSQYT